ncbi:MAG: hypothetical protein AAGF14_05835, partial [Pseudomonadota bacterium]
MIVLSLAAAKAASPNDTARILAGLPPAPGSPLAAITTTPGWQRHAAEMRAAWNTFERRQLNRIRVWAAAKLPGPYPAMFYMFGGPDFVHADAFYPNARTYVQAGLEPVGSVPDLSRLPPPQLAASLTALRQSLTNFFQYGYFITKEMGAQFKFGAFSGTLPVLYAFLARTDKTILKVEYIALRGNGSVVPVKGKGRPSGVKITFAGADRTPRTLYYFRTNLENAGVAKSGFLKFCAKLGTGGALLKSASYLMHVGGFSRVRDFVLKHSAIIVQDDSGIPLKYLSDGRWNLYPFGQYIPP